MSSKRKQNKNAFLLIAVVLLSVIAVYTAVNFSKERQEVSGGIEKEAIIAENAPKDTDLKIPKNELSDKVRFYPYYSGDIYMEVLAAFY